MLLVTLNCPAVTTGVLGTAVQFVCRKRFVRLSRRKPGKFAGQDRMTILFVRRVSCRVGVSITVTRKSRLKEFWPPLAVPPLSCTVTVIVAVPIAFGVCVSTRVPFGLGLV